MKLPVILFLLFFVTSLSQAQIPSPVLVGYWHNWNDGSAPYIPLDAIDTRYNLIDVSFAVPTSPSDMTMLFSPDIVNQAIFISQIQTLQSQGRKVLISIGGATTSIDLTTTVNKDAFISSMGIIINTFGFDGIDIDIEHGNAILINGGTIAAPGNTSQINLIEAIKQIMLNHWTIHGKKLLLTMAPETAYVHGGQSAFGGIWGGYLPIINALRDSLDLLHVQLYNSGSQYGIDGGIYTQGNADFIVAMTEAVIQGFNTSGGFFTGLPADKIAVGLPACSSAAGGGFVDSVNVKTALHYLLGTGPQPGLYSLFNTSGYPNLRGMMTWSVNWDAVSSCGGTYSYADIFEDIFNTSTAVINLERDLVSVFPNPSTGTITVSLPEFANKMVVTDVRGKLIKEIPVNSLYFTFQIDQQGIYLLHLIMKNERIVQKLVIQN